jgi:hypothetical protein
LFREGVELATFTLEVCNGQSHNEFTVSVFDGRYIQVFSGTDCANGVEVDIDDPQHTEMFPIRYVTFKSGPESDAYWLINTVDEPKKY